MKHLLLTVALIALAVLIAVGVQPLKDFGRWAGLKVHDALTGFMFRQGLMLGATFYSTEQTTINGPASGNAPATRIKANKQGGRLRIFEATYTVPASSGPAVADKIVWGKLPVRARIIGHLCSLSFAAGAASSTLNLGDNGSATRHLAATAVNAAGTAVPNAQSASGASFETSDDTANQSNSFVSSTDDCTLISTVAGASLGAGQVITLRMAYVCD